MTPLRPRILSRRNKLRRALWSLVWILLYRPSPRPFHGWRRLLLRLFGANIGRGAHPYPSARIWAPWNLEMGEGSCLSQYVDCYSVDRITLGAHVTVSQYSFLCTATHDYDQPDFPLLTAPIAIADFTWIAADVFLGPGVKVNEGAVILARSTVVSDVPAWTVMAGNPLRKIRQRKRPEVSEAGPGA